MTLAKRDVTCLVTFLVLYLVVFPTSSVQAVETSLVRVYGRVVDSRGEPIPDAHVILSNVQQVIAVKSNASGSYETSVPGQRFYTVCAYGDDPSTPGFDYVPAHQQLSVKETAVNVSFRLLPGASINAGGNIVSVENLYPPTTTFTIIDQHGLLSESETVTKYGWGVLSSYILGLSDRTVVVPSDIPVQIQASIYYPGGIERHFTIDMSHETMLPGDMLTVDLREHVLGADVDSFHRYLDSALTYAQEAEAAGFYLSYERNQLSRVENLIADAGSALERAALDEAFSDLREAYLILMSVEDGIASLYVNASQSVIFITPFLGFTAVVIAAAFTDNKRRGLTISLAVYGALVGVLYLVYPGYTVVQKPAFSLWAHTSWEVLLPMQVGVSFLGVFLAVYWLPYAFKEKTAPEGLRLVSALAAAFSMATRNLRRRKLRTFLTACFMLISVFAFMSLTSLSFEHGLFSETVRGQAPSEGFLLMKPDTAETQTTPFKHIPPTVLQEIEEWLLGRPETALAAPMIENIPELGVIVPPRLLTTIYASKSGLSFDILGVLGVFPSLEAEITKIDTVVVRGRFLSDEDVNGILVSEEAARTLHVEPNDTLTLYDRIFNVTGIFDGGKLDSLNDLDGRPLSPRYIIETRDPELPPFTFHYVPGFQVVIIHGETGRALPKMVISRVDVQTRNPGEIMTLARIAVLSWDGFEAYTHVAAVFHRLQIGEYRLASGFTSAMFPLVLVVLNVGSMMVGAVYERKREVAIMSSLGLNPFHISAVFVAEAMVIGVAAGSLGYVLGLTSYRFLAVFVPSFAVKQKVEPAWGMLVLVLSIASAVLGSALPAAKASIIVTPSLLKKWRIEEGPRVREEPWLLNLPLRIRREEVESFFIFMEERLRRSLEIKELEVSGEGTATRLSFTYVYTEEETVVTDNELYIEKARLPYHYLIRLASKIRQDMGRALYESKVRRTATFIRYLILQYSTEQANQRRRRQAL